MRRRSNGIDFSGLLLASVCVRACLYVWPYVCLRQAKEVYRCYDRRAARGGLWIWRS